MKTHKLYFLTSLFAILVGNSFSTNAQATTASTTNTVTAAAYLGSGSTSNFDVVFKRQAVAAGLIATNKTSFGLNSVAKINSVSLGVNAGRYTSGTTLGYNTYVGNDAGAGFSFALNSGNYNTFIGGAAGSGNVTGTNNVFLGYYSGGVDQNIGNNNTFLGTNSGGNANGSNNVLIGYNAGNLMTSSDKLYIENSNSETPLIWGDFAADQLKLNGKVGIGAVTTFPTNSLYTSYRLFVTGGILSDEVRVTLSSGGTWADYVFNKDYNLKSLSEVETFIKDNGHLPNVPSAAQVKEDGIELGNMAKIQQEKIEELTLYIIELNKKLEAQQKQIDTLIQSKQ